MDTEAVPRLPVPQLLWITLFTHQCACVGADLGSEVQEMEFLGQTERQRQHRQAHPNWMDDLGEGTGIPGPCFLIYMKGG